jgi:hypothetical protein
VLAIEASTGRVYKPNLDDILLAHTGEQCWYRVEDVGFANRTSLETLVRFKLATAHDVDETVDDVPPAKRCGGLEETWSFNYSSGYEVKKVPNQQRGVIPVSWKYRREFGPVECQSRSLIRINATPICSGLIRESRKNRVTVD